MKTLIIDVETTDLDPTRGDLVCIGVKDVESGKSVVFFDEESEEGMLREFLKYFHKNGFEEIVGFNLPFDFRFLISKCLKYSISANGLLKAKHTDLMMILKSGGKISYNFNRPGTLEEWSQLLFNQGKIQLSDSVANLFKARRLHEIVQYNKQDLELTFQLWKRMDDVLWKT
jgi:DNA polymerase elongation subunit (family B)